MSRPRPSKTADVVDIAPLRLRRACAPLSAWWQRSVAAGRFDPDQLQAALSPLSDLGPLPGPLGAEVAYLIQGAPDLDVGRISTAMETISRLASHAGRSPEPAPPRDRPPLQLSFADLDAEFPTQQRRKP